MNFAENGDSFKDLLPHHSSANNISRISPNASVDIPNSLSQHLQKIDSGFGQELGFAPTQFQQSRQHHPTLKLIKMSNEKLDLDSINEESISSYQH